MYLKWLWIEWGIYIVRICDIVLAECLPFVYSQEWSLGTVYWSVPSKSWQYVTGFCRIFTIQWFYGFTGLHHFLSTLKSLIDVACTCTDMLNTDKNPCTPQTLTRHIEWWRLPELGSPLQCSTAAVAALQAGTRVGHSLGEGAGHSPGQGVDHSLGQEHHNL